MRTRLPIFLALALLAGCCPTARPRVCREISRREFLVERVTEGNTFDVRYDGQLTTVRLWGVDAPEKRDSQGPAATWALAGLILGKTVRLEFPAPPPHDSSGPWLCKVYLGQMDVGEEMVLRGHAERYVPKR